MVDLTSPEARERMQKRLGASMTWDGFPLSSILSENELHEAAVGALAEVAAMLKEDGD